MMRYRLVLAALLTFACATPASAGIVISGAKTENMSCSHGVCAPLAHQATLNVNDLETLLASRAIEVTTYGSGIQAKKITVGVRLTWNKHTLTLSAKNSIRIAQPVLLKNTASLILAFGKDLYLGQPIADRGTGSLTLSRVPVFGPNGKITFANLSAGLEIGSVSYTLENALPKLAGGIAANPQGAFALANSYDASGDGTYAASPISTNFLGNFEGLGNTISNISVNNTDACCVGGLFQSLSSSALVSDARLANVSVISVEGAAGLAYDNFGEIEHSTVTGTVRGGKTGDMGGLVGDNYGGIAYSSSAAAVSTAATIHGVNVGGLIAEDFTSTFASFATGAVSAGDGSGNVGGLVGNANPLPQEGGSPDDCYATGKCFGRQRHQRRRPGWLHPSRYKCDGTILLFDRRRFRRKRQHSRRVHRVERRHVAIRLLGHDDQRNRYRRGSRECDRRDGTDHRTVSIRPAGRIRSGDLGGESQHQQRLSLSDRQPAGEVVRKAQHSKKLVIPAQAGTQRLPVLKTRTSSGASFQAIAGAGSPLSRG
jgi:hypothetical protein